MLKKRVLLIILILLVSITGVAYSQSLQVEVKNNLVWNTYCNDYYTIKYPPQWNKIASGLEVGFAPSESEGLTRIDILIDEVGIAKNNFYRKMKQKTKNIEPKSLLIKQKKKFKLDGQPAYKLVVANKKQGMKAVFVGVYKWGAIFKFRFLASNKQYNQQLAVVKEMISSFRFSNFPRGSLTEEDKNKPAKVVKAGITSSKAVEDAEYMWHMMEELHPNLYHSRSRQKTKGEFEQLVADLKTKATWGQKELYNKLAAFAAGFKDGHVRVNSKAPWRQHRSQLGTDKLMPPFLVSFTGDNLIVTANFSKQVLPAGAVIKAINGIKTIQLVAKMEQMISAGLKRYAYHKLAEDFPFYFWANFRLSSIYTVKYKSQAGQVKTVKLEGITPKAYHKKKQELNVEQAKDHQLTYPEDNVALLTVNAFDADNDEEKKEFKMFINQSLKKISQNQSKALIIDLRSNGGGNVSLMKYLYKFIAKEPYRIGAKKKEKLSNYVIKKWDARLSWVASVVDKNRLYTYQPELKESEVYSEYKFTGPVYVLVGPGTFSAATDFTAMIKDFERGIVVGEETGMSPSHYGFPVSFKLPNSYLQIDCSSQYFLRPAGFDKARGLIPDVKVEVDPVKKVQGQDQVLAKTLQLITEETK